MVTPFLPRADATNAGELVMYRQVEKLAERHRLSLATFSDADAASRRAIESLHDLGVDVHAIPYGTPGCLRRWQRRPGLGLRWLRGDRPLRVLDFALPAMQRLLDRLSDEVSPDV